MAHSVKHPTLNLGSGHDLTVRGFEPHIGLCTEGGDPAWNSLSSLYSYPTCARSLSLSLSLIKLKNKN